jgi:hypothetical protein
MCNGPPVITPELGAEYGQQVAEIYRDAELRILARISQALGVGIGAPDWQVRALAQLQQVRQITLEELRKASPEAAALIRASLAEAYGLGGLAVFDDVGALLPVIEAMPAAQQAAVGALARELTSAINSATPGILRAVDDVYRAVIADAVGSRLAGGEFQREAIQRSLQRFLGDGIKTVQTGRGRMGIADYVHMAVRTGTAKASLQGQFDTMSASGLDLIIVSPGPRACGICDRWARLILTTGKSTRRKPDTSLTTGRAIAVRVDGTLAEARQAGVFHPNCRCSSKTYLPGVTKPAELQRPPWDAEGYAAQQRQRQIELGIRKAKTSQAIALTPEGAARAAQRVRDGQAVMRAHLSANPELKRQGAREQLRG